MAKKINIYNNAKPKIVVENLKKVSVIIPNYNYQDFIIERIDSILMQTYPIYELIILDDCSTDKSVEVIEEKIKQIPSGIKVTFVKNDINSGCVFKQWEKGFNLASGDYIWLAEADDSAKSTFVEEVIKGFDDKNVVLSYCESARIDENNMLIREKSDDLYDMCRTGEWKQDYIKDGKDEIIEHLSVTNTILNVSSVMWKKRDYSEIFKKAGEEFKVAGDWYIYYNVLKNGKIAWNSKPLNYYRKHSRSVTTNIKADREFREIWRLQDEIGENYELPKEIKEKQELRRSFIMPTVSEEVLNEYRLSHFDPNAKKKIAWVIPHPGKGSGGHRTIIQNVNALIRAGYECDIYVEEDNVSTAEMVKEKINEYYEKCDAGVYVGIRMRKDYDLLFATGWQIVDFVRSVPAKKKAYFIQDFEPWFFPMGDQYIITENSYRYGFKPVTIGKWLAHKMQAEYDNPVEYFDFGADLNVYKKLDNIEKENAICFVYQTEKSRRCDYIGLKALRIVKTLRPDIQIYLYGSNMPATFEFECKNLNIIPIEKCNELYNKCKVGICMSASNPSRIPFEMMAAGLPVVELYKENNIYDMPDGGVLLARPTPEAIASARKSMSEFGINYMKDYPLQRGFEQFLKAVDDMLNTPYNNTAEIKPVYNKAPFEATKEAIDAYKNMQPVIHVDNRGKAYRFLRRVKRKLKDILVKFGIKK